MAFVVGGENANPTLESYNGAGVTVRLKHRSRKMQLAIWDVAIFIISKNIESEATPRI